MTLASPDENVRQAAIERTKSVIDFAALLKTQVIIRKLRGDLQLADVGRSWEWMKRGFQIICEYASSRQVRITIEPQSRFAINTLNTVFIGPSLPGVSILRRAGLAQFVSQQRDVTAQIV